MELFATAKAVFFAIIESAMTPEQFVNSLAALGWKQSDFCRKTDLSKQTPSRWVTGLVPIPAWVAAYLSAMLDIKQLHSKYVEIKR
jgi:hypothetical protein